jgi:hypothetical protein
MIFDNYCRSCFGTDLVYIFVGYQCRECGAITYPTRTFPERNDDMYEDLCERAKNVTPGDFKAVEAWWDEASRFIHGVHATYHQSMKLYRIARHL